MRKISIALILMLAAITAGLWLGCSTAPTGNINTNKAPQTFLVNVPPGNDTINAVSLVYWYGVDEDGVVAYYEIFFSGDSVNSSTITGWDSVFASSDTMKLTVDDVPDSLIVIDTVIDTIIAGSDTTYKFHEIWNFKGFFYVRSVDEEGLEDPTPAIRGWDVISEKPVVEISAPDGSSGILRYYRNSIPVFWSPLDTAVMFYVHQTNPLWQGLEIWWNRVDTLNSQSNTPIGYRFKIDNYEWSQWTDMNPVTEGDSFIVINDSVLNVNLQGGFHTLYLQGRNASHVESNIDSIAFRTINTDVSSGAIGVLFSTTYTYGQRAWYENLFSMIRPGTTFRYYNRSSGVISKDSLKDLSLVIYIRDDMSKSDPGFVKDTIELLDYINVGGKIWTFGPWMISAQPVLNLDGIAGYLIHDLMGLSVYTNCDTVQAFSGATVTQYATGLGFPNVNLVFDPANGFPPNKIAGFLCENFPSSDPNITVLYNWDGLRPWDETPCAVLYNNPSLGVKSASFGFSGKSLQRNETTLEPIASVYDKVLEWFGY
ncbi:hypothetical protein JXA84_03280 [candidate division WOR-3 bacterium]|nr:hypothetical protein [candidate division WOR-3 bacterium]